MYPKIKIVGDCEDLSLNELQDNIIRHNFEFLEKNPIIKVLHKKRTKKNDAWIIFAEVSKDTCDIIAKKKCIFIGWVSCKVYDDFNIMRCYKCCQYGHTSKVCNNNKSCHLCAQPHEKSAPCKNTHLKCINCFNHNRQHGTNVRTDHAASNIVHCFIYKQCKKSSIKKIDYNSHPVLN